MNLNALKSACASLQNYEPRVSLPPSVPIIKPYEDENEGKVTINRIDIENLSNFTKVWTDILDVNDVEKQFSEKEDKTVTFQQFEINNNLIHVGFFYVQLNPKCSPLEFLGLLEKIPFEQFCTPGTHQISFVILSQLFGEKSEALTIQLMVLGDFFKYWLLINPYTRMHKTNMNTKLLLSGMGNFAVQISPGYLKTCLELVLNFEGTSLRQVNSDQIGQFDQSAYLKNLEFPD